MRDADARFNPFPGLRSFEPDEDHLFFGREERIDELLMRLRETRFLAVVGTSGSGKSSLVRSGLIPSLYSGFMTRAGSSWRVAVFRPGDNPVGNLAEALNDPDVLGLDGELADTNRSLLEATLRRSTVGIADCVKGASVPPEENILVLVDQFEELFRFKGNTRIKDSGDDASAFVKLLLEASRQDDVPVYIVITMRSDFIGNFTEFQGLAEAVNDGQYLVPRMTRDERRSAIVGPVAVGGGEISPRLVLRILNDVGDSPDQLPTMQHALMRTWDHWAGDHVDGEAIDLRHYEAIGTIGGALSQHAEEAFAELGDDGGKKVAELMFKSLTDRASDNRGVRAPKRLSEICAVTGATEEQAMAVVERFRAPGRSFLMPPADVELHTESIIDISHESLMRIWTRLIQWVDEEARSVQVYRRISKAAAQYQEGQAGLFRDPELQLAVNWRDEAKPTASWAEPHDPAFERAMLFLEHSSRQRDLEIAEKERQRRRQLQWAKRLAIILGSAALVTLVFGLYALLLRIEAQDNLDEAIRQQAIAEERKLEAERQRSAADEERVKAEEAHAAADQQRRLAEQQRQIAVDERHRAETQEEEALRQKSQAEAARALEAVARTDAETQRTIAFEEKERADALRVQAELSEAEAQRLRMLSVARELAIQTTSRLAQEGRQQRAALLALQAYRLHQRNGGELDDPDVFAALRTSLARLTDVQQQVFRHHRDAVRCVAVTATPTRMASAGDDGIVVVVDPSAPDDEPTLSSTVGAEVRALVFTDGGDRLAVGALDGSIRVVTLAPRAGGAAIFRSHGPGVSALAYRPQGSVLAAGTLDGNIRVWSLGADRTERRVRKADAERVTSLAFTADGLLLAAVAAQGVLVIDVDVDDEDARPQQLLPGREVSALATGRGGEVAAGTRDGTLILLSAASIEEWVELPGHTAAVTSLDFAPDGGRLASASLDSHVRLWDVHRPDRAPIDLADHSGWVWAVRFTADGERLVSGGADRTMRTWPTRSEPLARAICDHTTRDLTREEWSAFLPADIPWEATCPR